MRNKDLIQRAIHSCMDRIGLPYNGAFKVKYKDKTEFCKICKGIDGYYELQCLLVAFGFPPMKINSMY